MKKMNENEKNEVDKIIQDYLELGERIKKISKNLKNDLESDKLQSNDLEILEEHIHSSSLALEQIINNLVDVMRSRNNSI